MFAVLSNAVFDPPKTKKGMSVGSFPIQRQATKLSDLFLVLFLEPSKLRLCVHYLLFMVHLQRYGTRPTGNLRLTILEEYLFNFDETFFFAGIDVFSSNRLFIVFFAPHSPRLFLAILLFELAHLYVLFVRVFVLFSVPWS